MNERRQNRLQQDLLDLEQKLKRSEFDAGVSQARAILDAVPGHVAATRLLGTALRGSGRHAEAVDVLHRLAERAPHNALVQNSLGAALRASGDIEGARAAFERACALAPDQPPFWYNHAIALFMLDQAEAGLRAIDRAIALAPTDEGIRFIRSEMLREHGRAAQVAAEYRAVLARNPGSPWSWFGLANLRNVPLSVEDIAAVRHALSLHEAPGRERTTLLFVLAKALEDNARYAEAFAVLAQANAAQRASLEWDAAAFSAGVDEMLAAFPSARDNNDAQQGAEAIFIVSLPRAGSTLLEQILASHSQVEGAGESDSLRTVLTEEDRRRGLPMRDWAKDASAQDWLRLGHRYLEESAAYRRRPRFTDKSLSNWLMVGAIRAMLPAATIVFCRRDPVEAAFSCYRQLFSRNGHPYSYDLRELAAYWHDFERACRHWRALYPGRIHEFVYEDLVRDQERHTRALLAHCGLEFESACLRFFATERRIATISSSQVREPLRGDTARADKYGALLDPLRASLRAAARDDR